MKRSTLLSFVVALVLLVAAAFSASAKPVVPGREVPMGRAVFQYFLNNGVSDVELFTPAAQLTAASLSKISAIESSPGFLGMIQDDLRGDVAAFGNTVYVTIGSMIYEYSQASKGGMYSFSAVPSS